MDRIAVVEIAIKRSTLAVAFTVLALAQPGQCFAQESSKSALNAEQTKMIELDGISNWLRARFSQSETSTASSRKCAASRSTLTRCLTFAPCA